MDDSTPKLHIDEDWKHQAQAEKEALAREAAKSAAATSTSASPPPPHSAPPSAPPVEREPAAASPHAARAPLPAASLPLLLSMFASEAMVALGQIPSPATGQPEVDLDAARHYIDMLAVIEEKTEGNRAPEESAMLSQLLHDLRMAFVAVRGR